MKFVIKQNKQDLYYMGETNFLGKEYPYFTGIRDHAISFSSEEEANMRVPFGCIVVKLEENTNKKKGRK